MRISIFIIPLLLFSCTGENEEESSIIEKHDSSEIELNTLVEFNSEIRPDSTLWDLTKTFVDTMEFVVNNQAGDYSMAIFQRKDEVGANLCLLQPIDPDLSGSIFEVTWRVDSCWSAGEGDLLYYDEWIESVKLIEEVNTFDPFMKEFLNAYSEEGDGDIVNLISEDIGLYVADNPGAACWASRMDSPPYVHKLPLDIKIVQTIPEGDNCEGYEGTETGLYYEYIQADQLPKFSFAYDNGDEKYEEPYLEYYDKEGLFVHMIYIHEGNHSMDFYFIRPGDRWFFWIVSYCDCSA